MKKSNFIIVSVFAFSLCAFFECSDTYKSESVRSAELGVTANLSSPKNKITDMPEEINLAETGDFLQVEKTTKDSIYLGFAPYSNERPAYEVELIEDSIFILDSRTGIEIHAEKYDSGSALAKAILKDNQ